MSDQIAEPESLEEIGQLLLERGSITPDALRGALYRARRTGEPSEDVFLDTLIETGACSEGDVVAILAERSGFPGVDLSRSAFLLSVLEQIPRPVAEQDQLLPLSTEGGRLHIAVTTPGAANDSIDEVRFITGMDISLYIAVKGPLARCIDAAFDSREKGQTVWRGKKVAKDAPPLLFSLQPSPFGPETSAAEAQAAQENPDDQLGYSPDTIVDTQPEEEILEGELLEDLPAGAALDPVVTTEPIKEPPRHEPRDISSPVKTKPMATTTPIASALITSSAPGVKKPSAPGRPKKPPSLEIQIGADSEDEDEEEEEIVGSVHTGPKRILVVDDEPDIIRLCTRALQIKGYVVESAADGALAEARLKKAPPPDLVLLDAMLPQVHGFELCQRIKSNKLTRNVPVIMMSAVYRGWRFAQDARETYGADDFIEKPFHIADMLRRVDERLAEGKATSSQPKASTEKLYRSGVDLLAEGKAAEGRKALESAAKEDPFSPRIQFALGGALAAMGDTYRAITAYERAVELRPQLFPALKNLATLYLEKGFRQKAHETLERAFACAPEPMAREDIRIKLAQLS